MLNILTGKTHPQNKTQALAKSMYIDVSVVGILNEHLYEVLMLILNFQKHKTINSETPSFETGSFYSICFNIGF